MTQKLTFGPQKTHNSWRTCIMHRLSLNKAGDKNTDQQKSEYTSSRTEPLLPKLQFCKCAIGKSTNEWWQTRFLQNELLTENVNTVL
jgi:hypothetical protein